MVDPVTGRVGEGEGERRLDGAPRPLDAPRENRTDGLRAALTEDAFGLAALSIAVVGVLLLSPELPAKSLVERAELLVATPEGLGLSSGEKLRPAKSKWFQRGHVPLRVQLLRELPPTR